LHPTSLPVAPGNGDLGHQAYRFIEFLAASGMSVWQMLPLGPTHDDGSPYQCLSVHAGNPLLISLEWLSDMGWLDRSVMDRNDTPAAEYRHRCIQAAYEGFMRCGAVSELDRYQSFLREHVDWLDDYALYMALREEAGGRPWMSWPAPLRDYDSQALNQSRARLDKEIQRIRFAQFVFFEQWRELKAYAHGQGILLFGDMPIFVAHDSAEVWAHREYFAIDEHGRAEVVAGVPPDYFSATGQRWGNPHYRWRVMQEDGFGWWIQRMRTQLEFFDLVRIDHFRGFEAYWEIPAEAETAELGRWIKAPGEALLSALYAAFDWLPVVAEDLGTITPEVDALRSAFGIPGMKILQFAFDGNNDNPYLPHRYERNYVAYTGTHDNDTGLSWYRCLPDELQHHVGAYLGYSREAMPWPLIRCVLACVAQYAIIPMQDVLELGNGHRMNTPGTIENNWRWRYSWDQVDDTLPERLSELARLYGRS
jgi:4-alpha-glucanotransferase